MLKQFFAACLLVGSAGAHASSIYKSVGLLWLDPRITASYDVETAIAQTLPMGRFAGWRPATSSEILAYVGERTGVLPLFETMNIYAPSTLTGFMLGNGWDRGGNISTRGIFREESGTFGVFAATIQNCAPAYPPCGPRDTFQISYTFAGTDQIGGYMPEGSLQLVAPLGTSIPAVPEPASFFLLAAGVTFLTARQRLRNRRRT